MKIVEFGPQHFLCLSRVFQIYFALRSVCQHEFFLQYCFIHQWVGKLHFFFFTCFEWLLTKRNCLFLFVMLPSAFVFDTVNILIVCLFCWIKWQCSVNNTAGTWATPPSVISGGLRSKDVHQKKKRAIIICYLVLRVSSMAAYLT